MYLNLGVSFYISEMMSLSNAAQSTTMTIEGCTSGRCVAAKAIDGNADTQSVTTKESRPWWVAELNKITQIKNIILYLDEHNFNQNRLMGFKIETSMTEGQWEVCKGPYNVEKPINPHITTCENPTIAKYIRLSRQTSRGGRLAVVEVKITRLSEGKH